MTFAERLKGAILLHPNAYADVEADHTALKQSVGVVLLSSCCVTLGAHGSESAITLATVMAASLLAWVVWSWIAFAVGTTLLRTTQTEADWAQVLRTTGFATAPGLIAAAGILRPLAGIAVFIAIVWTIVAFTTAVKEALDYSSTTRAALVCTIAWGFHVFCLVLAMSASGS